ncbi:hypothetical protein FOXB_04594, partial [Fusarium oxysporum f. sp. conglutinans Fo5176]
LYNINLPPR